MMYKQKGYLKYRSNFNDKKTQGFWESKFIRYLLLVFCLFFLLLLSSGFFWNLERIVFFGGEGVEKEEILALIGIKKGDNLWFVDKNEIEDKILNHYPFLKAVEIDKKFLSYKEFKDENNNLKRKWVKTLEINLIHKEAAANVVTSMGISQLDLQGRLFLGHNNQKEKAKLNLWLQTDYEKEIGKFDPGIKICDSSVLTISSQMVSRAEIIVNDKVKKIFLDGYRDFSFLFSDDFLVKFTVEKNPADMLDKLALLSQEFEKKGNWPSEYIDLRGDYVYLK